MINIAFLTAQNYPELTSDEALLIEALKNYDIWVTPKIWENPNLDLNNYPMTIIRTVWDYHEKFNAFQAFLQANQSINLFNNQKVIQWNINKSYFNDLQNLGLKIPYFKIFTKPFSLIDFMQAHNLTRAILKPCISAGGRNTYLVNKNTAAKYQDNINEILAFCPVIVQEFIPEIQTQGEWSFIYFNRIFSHAILKKTAKQEFKVQERFGGSVKAINPSTKILNTSNEILKKLPYDLLYARIDAIITNSEFYIMELELFEPSLFLAYNEKATDNFCQAIKSRLKEYV